MSDAKQKLVEVRVSEATRKDARGLSDLDALGLAIDQLEKERSSSAAIYREQM